MTFFFSITCGENWSLTKGVSQKRDFVYSRRYTIETWLSASRSRTKRRMFERKKKNKKTL